MTDKEQTIIDGIDVSRCRYFLKDTEGQDYETDEFVKGCCEAKGSCIGYEFAGYGLCRGDKDCYFKQLQRKTQEYNDLLEQHKELDDRANRMIEEKYNLARECEGLKDKLKIYEKMFDNSEFRVALTDIRTGERDIREQRDKRLTKENAHYHKALEEIGEIIKNSTKDFSHIDWEAKAYHALTAVDKISDIINKAKGYE